MAAKAGDVQAKRYLAAPPLPQAADSVWKAYRRIRGRKGGGMGPAPIEWADVDAFIRSSGAALAAWEIQLIEELDDLWLTVVCGDSYDWRPDGEEG